nr:hypothetical protein CFP56_41452 [Quercus suber]
MLDVFGERCDGESAAISFYKPLTTVWSSAGRGLAARCMSHSLYSIGYPGPLSLVFTNPCSQFSYSPFHQAQTKEISFRMLVDCYRLLTHADWGVSMLTSFTWPPKRGEPPFSEAHHNCVLED